MVDIDMAFNEFHEYLSYRARGICGVERDEFVSKLRLRKLLDDESSLEKYQEIILGIEKRWDMVMRRRSAKN